MLSQRWHTLRTLVLSLSMSNSTTFHRKLLNGIFATNYNWKVEEWIKQDKECFIYIDGWLNGERSTDFELGPREGLLEYLEKLVLLTENFENPFKLRRVNPGKPGPRDFASPLPNRGIVETLEQRLSPLVELNLVECHDMYSSATRLNFFEAASKTLEVLALPFCFILFPMAESYLCSGCRATNYEITISIAQAFRKMKLKKLFLEGNDYSDYHRVRASRGYRGRNFCSRCFSGPLGTYNLPHLKEFDHLEELTARYIRVNLNKSLLGRMANPKAHTIRIVLGRGSWVEVRDLLNFVQRWLNLQTFKLSCPTLALNSENLWEALRGSAKLRQLCLGTERELNLTTSEIENFLPSVGDLELFHLHRSQEFRVENRSFGNQQKTLWSPVDWQDGRGIHVSRFPQVFPGRSFCCSDVITGEIKPNGSA